MFKSKYTDWECINQECIINQKYKWKGEFSFEKQNFGSSKDTS